MQHIKEHMFVCIYDTYPDMQDGIILRDWALESGA